MTEKPSVLRRARGSRRRILRAGGLVSGGLLLAGCASDGDSPVDPDGTVDGEGTGQDVVGKAFMFNDEYRPGAKFRVVSGVVEATPDVEGIQEQNVWEEANTRIIEYLNTGERVSLFPIAQAEIERGSVYELSARTMGLFDREEGIVSIEYEVPDEETVPGTAANGIETIEGGGEALVRNDNFHPGALFRVDSDVVEWRPEVDVQGGGDLAEYNTRYGEYLNTGDEFLFYPAHSASIERGAVYRLQEDSDVSNPAGELVAVDLDRVSERSLGEGQ